MIKNLDTALNIANTNLPGILSSYASFLGNDVGFGNPNHLKLTPDKGYTAITDVPVTRDGREVGNLYIVAFVAGDGTGDDKTYKPSQLVIPSRLKIAKNQKIVFPRDKSETLLEACFPLFSIHNSKCLLNAVSLEGLTISNKDQEKAKIVTGYKLGVDPRYFNSLLRANRPGESQIIQLTTGYTRGGERFGDPHAIFYPLEELNQNALQVVGFLAVREMNNPLNRILDEKAQLPLPAQ